ncbi:polysaccharide biosynthesis protein [uncultured Oscillibacter sp.]|uniref:putative polysaccharide biosynthesis protein n=1 Tax=uncultured Oscillibacter sp. TaxID=876091 RepID=UPI0025FAD1A3|nr:polysaccharide biosynthesis protein [uncultured Oscillibacter sp.]
MSTTKKQSFLGGAAILASAVAVVKAIGFFYKIPLNNILGEEGKTYFDSAYQIYNVLLSISTAGLPIALSKLVSEAQAKGRENEKRRLFSTAIWIFFALGLAGFAIMSLGTGWVAARLHNESAYWAIKALSPAVFCVCLLACMRGYTQGQGDMTPTAVSQVLEALCKLGIGLALAWYIFRAGMGQEFVAAGAILGVTIGTVLSMLFLIAYLLTHRSPGERLDVPAGRAVLARRILAIGVPITLSNSAMSIINLVDTSIVMGRLQDGLGLTEESAAALKGAYGYAMDMLNLPPAFVFPVTMSLIPVAAAALARKDHREVDRIVSSAFRLIAILALPCGVGLSVLSTPIMRLVLPARPEAALAAGPHLRVLGLACIFVCLMNLTNAILQTYGKVHLPVLTVILGGLVKIVLNYLLVGEPEINIHGAPISTLCCYLVIAGLNLSLVWLYSPEKPRYLQIFFKPVLASALMGGGAWAVHGFVSRALSGAFLGAATEVRAAYLTNAAATLCGILAGVAVYAVLVVVLRILRAEDLKTVPHGAKLAKLLHLR